MIPTIGIMIGFYILTRMVSLTLKAEEPKTVKLLAAVTIVVAVVGLGSLFTTGGVLDAPSSAIRDAGSRKDNRARERAYPKPENREQLEYSVYLRLNLQARLPPGWRHRETGWEDGRAIVHLKTPDGVSVAQLVGACQKGPDWPTMTIKSGDLEWVCP